MKTKKCKYCEYRFKISPYVSPLDKTPTTCFSCQSTMSIIGAMASILLTDSKVKRGKKSKTYWSKQLYNLIK